MTDPTTTVATTEEQWVGDYRSNPFGLVYQGAITSNEEGSIAVHPVTYQVNGLEIAANVYTPAGYSENDALAAVAVAHPNGGVKEQVAGLYAQRLAEHGFVAITADAAFQGGSAGEPRQTDKPQNRVEDIHGMADFLGRFPGVDRDRVGLLGICGGGGYSVKAAQSDKRFKAVATVSMFNSGRVRRNGMQDSQLDSVQRRLREASKARTEETAGGAVRYVGDGPMPTPEQIAALPFPLYREGFEYYGGTHLHPNASGRYTMSSLLDLMTFDATDEIALINQPLLMIAGSAADTKYMTDDAFPKATGTNDKTLHIIEGASHIQTYWVPRYVDEALGQISGFFDRTIS